MPLPFEKDDKRKWQCFVCGKSYTDYEGFKAHVLENHEEGQDYVLCPLERCGAPVRDVKLHFRAKHPYDEVPKGGCLRATVWRDMSSTGKMKVRKLGFRKGEFVSKKNGGKVFEYKSGMECEVFELLEQIPEVVSFDYEPFKSGIPYLFEGKPHKYHPDLAVAFEDQRVEIWEIKPGSQTALPINDAKWVAADAFCKAKGWDFIVITEKGLEKLRKLARRSLMNEEQQE